MSKRISKIIPSFLVDKASCTRQFESEFSLHSLASLFPIKEGFFRIPPFNGLYDPFGSPYRGQKPQKEGGNRPTRFYLFENLPVLPYR